MSWRVRRLTVAYFCRLACRYQSIWTCTCPYRLLSFIQHPYNIEPTVAGVLLLVQPRQPRQPHFRIRRVCYKAPPTQSIQLRWCCLCLLRLVAPLILHCIAVHLVTAYTRDQQSADCRSTGTTLPGFSVLGTPVELESLQLSAQPESSAGIATVTATPIPTLTKHYPSCASSTQTHRGCC